MSLLSDELCGAVRRGDYRYAMRALYDYHAQLADVPGEQSFMVDGAVCISLSDECVRKPGEALEAVRLRAAAIVDAGVIEFAIALAIEVDDKFAVLACTLIKDLSKYDVVEIATLQRCTTMNVVDKMMRILSDKPADWGDERHISLAHLNLLREAYDALMGAAGVPSAGPSHMMAAASVPIGHCAEAICVANSGKLCSIAVRHAVKATKILAKLAGIPNAQRPEAALWKLLRSTGRAFRWIWICAACLVDATEASSNFQAAFEIARAMTAYADNAALQHWGLTYVFLPIVHQSRTRRGQQAFNFDFCRGRCCIDMTAALSPSIIELVNLLDAWKLATCAARVHPTCVRPAARLMAGAAAHTPEVQRILNAQGAPDVLRQIERRHVPQRTRRGAPASLPDTVAVANADEEEDVSSDGERLSEWGDDDGPPPNLAGEASTHALVARALRALAGETAAVVAERAAAAAAAADAAAAALLAELESEKQIAAVAAARKKSKKGKKKKGAKHSGQASGTAAAARNESGDSGDDTAQLLNAQLAAASPPADAAAAETAFPWLSLSDAPGGPRASAASAAAAMPEDAPHEDDDLCVICLDAPRDTPLAGCGDAHPAALCADCARRLLAAGGAPACPLCRAPATL